MCEMSDSPPAKVGAYEGKQDIKYRPQTNRPMARSRNKMCTLVIYTNLIWKLL